MLDVLRQSAGGPLAKTLIGLLVISFGVWGVSGSILGGGGDSVVEVGETKVGLIDYRLAYDGQLNQLSRQFQTRLSREQANSLGLEQNVLAQLVSGAVLDENARKMGLGLSQENLASLIGDDPNFLDASGRFSRSQLQLVLRQIGMREIDYVTNRKAVAIRNQIMDGTTASVGMPKTFLKAYQAYQNEKRVFDYVVIGKEAVAKPPSPTSAEVDKFYQDNKQDYVAPEYRKLKILKLEAQDIANPDDVSREDLEAAYESEKSKFVTPEKRRIQQLVLDNAEQAADIAKQLAAGTTFESIALSLGKSINDIDLGLFQKSGLPDKNVAEAAFALDLNSPSDVIEGLFGPVIVRVSEIEPEQVTPFAEVEDQLREQVAVTLASDELFDTHDQIEDERAAGDDLDEAARKAGLTIRIIEAVDSKGLKPDGSAVSGIPDLDRLLQQAFETGVGVEADPVDVGSNGYIWYNVEEITPDRQKPLDEVRSDAEQAWTAAETEARIVEISENIAKRVRNGEDFNVVLGEILPKDSLGKSVEAIRSGSLQRGANSPTLSRDAITAGFNSANASVHVTTSTEADKRVVLKVAEIDAGSGDPLAGDVTTQLNAAASDDLLAQVVGDLQAREDVLVNRQAIEAALSY